MPKIKITIEVDAFLKLLQESAWDRPSAFYVLAEYLKIKNPRELGMHADPSFWDSKVEWQEERDYLKRVFKERGMRIPNRLNSKDWDT